MYYSNFATKIRRRLARLTGANTALPETPSAELQAAASAKRFEVATEYLHGRGLEVGALFAPLKVSTATKVIYVDRMAVADLRLQYPELKDQPLVDPDIVDDGEKLTKLADASQDFLISNHFIEHAQDPIGTIKRHLEVVKPGGVLYVAVPDMCRTFDFQRRPTTFKHLLRDFREGPAWSYEQHLREYAHLVDGKTGRELKERMARLRETNYSIHMHVWNYATLKGFFASLIAELGLPMRVIEMIDNPGLSEHICIIQRM